MQSPCWNKVQSNDDWLANQNITWCGSSSEPNMKQWLLSCKSSRQSHAVGLNTCNVILFYKLILEARCLRPLRRLSGALVWNAWDICVWWYSSYNFGSFSARNPVQTPVLALDFFQFTSLGFATSPAFSFLGWCLRRMALPPVPVLQTLPWNYQGVVGTWGHCFEIVGGCTASPERNGSLLLLCLPQHDGLAAPSKHIFAHG